MGSDGQIMLGFSLTSPKLESLMIIIVKLKPSIFIDLAHTKIDPQDILPFGLSYSMYHDEELGKSSADAKFDIRFSSQSNPYANVLYYSIWAVALTTINRSLSVLNDFLSPASIRVQGLGMCLRSNFLHSRFKVPLAG